MTTFIEGAGWFIWPLGVCSFLAVFIVVERLLALRPGRVLPAKLLSLLAQPNPPPLPAGIEKSAGGRIIRFFQRNNPDAETLKAYSQMELTRLERSLFLLDTTVGVAPLIGLLGTVYGLFTLFPAEGMPTAANLTRGVGLALTTTILGLLIAIPALVFSNYIYRILEVHSARVNMLVERLCSLGATGVVLTNAVTSKSATSKTTPAESPPVGSVPGGAKPATAAAKPGENPGNSATSAPAVVPPPKQAPAAPSVTLARHTSVPPKLEFVLKPLPSAPKPKPGLPPR